MHTDMNRTVDKGYCFQQILYLGSSGTLHEEGPISHPVVALKGSGYSMETLLHRERRKLAQSLLLACRRQINVFGSTIIR